MFEMILQRHDSVWRVLTFTVLFRDGISARAFYVYFSYGVRVKLLKKKKKCCFALVTRPGNFSRRPSFVPHSTEDLSKRHNICTAFQTRERAVFEINTVTSR